MSPLPAAPFTLRHEDGQPVWPWPYATAEVPAVPLRWKARPEDFRVEELPAVTPVGHGDHLYLCIEKRGIPTDEAVRRLARALGKRPRDAGVAGRKDAQAVALQTVSFEHVDDQRRSALAQAESDELRVLAAERHTTKLKRGQSLGNRFQLALREIEPERAGDVRRVLDLLIRRGLPNGFGAQRFGMHGDNAAAGLALLEDAGAPGRHGGPRARRGPARPEARFLVSALQSWLFNEVLAARSESYDRLLTGDLALDHASGRVFPAKKSAEEAECVRRGELSPTGPLVGRALRSPEADAGALEAAVLALHPRGLAALTRHGRWSWPGSRRPLRVPLRAVALSAGTDEHGPFTRLDFDLPPGSYASVLVTELAKDRLRVG